MPHYFPVAGLIAGLPASSPPAIKLSINPSKVFQSGGNPVLARSLLREASARKRIRKYDFRRSAAAIYHNKIIKFAIKTGSRQTRRQAPGLKDCPWASLRALSRTIASLRGKFGQSLVPDYSYQGFRYFGERLPAVPDPCAARHRR